MKEFFNFAKQHLVDPEKQDTECCICLNPSDKETIKCNHPLCLECFYKLTDTSDKCVKCPVCRCVMIDKKKKKRILNGHFIRLKRLAVDESTIKWLDGCVLGCVCSLCFCGLCYLIL
jgi:hypothetical protein